MKYTLKAAAPAVTVLALTLGMTACGSGTSSDADAAKSADAGAGAVTITLENKDGKDQCTMDTTEVAAGPTTFTVENTSAASITEVELLQQSRILGEKENLAPGLGKLSFTVTLDGGDYEIYCPNGDQEETAFTVTGEATAPSGDVRTLLEQGAEDYAAYVRDQLGYMVDSTKALSDAVDSGDLQAAQKAYATARPFYEKAESAVDAFGDPKDNSKFYDYLIDMRESSPVDPKVGWSGFHAVERDLFKSKKITDDTKKYAADLATNSAKLNDLAADLEFTPEDLANGAADLLEEVQTTKITGEEEKYSHIDLMDFAGNVEGAAQAFSDLKPGLVKIDADLVKDIDGQFTAVNDLLDEYRDKDELGGYTRWTKDAQKKDAKTFSHAVQKLHDPLSTMAEKIATYNG